jgi:hypothetical protein
MHCIAMGTKYKGFCRFIYLDLQTIAYVLYRAHQIASHMLISTWLAILNRACARAI